MSPWIWALVNIGGRLVSAYLISFVVVGLFWRLLAPGSRFPTRTIVVIALVLTAPKVVEEVAMTARMLPQSVLASELQVINQTFLDVLQYDATREEAHARIAALSFDRWPAEVRASVTAGLFTKANRYSDIHQSLATGRVVRTPLAGAGSGFEELRRVDEKHWTPLLEAAARGEPVQLLDVTLTDASESWAVAVTATRARIIVAQALSEAHGMDLQLLDAEMQLATAFDWGEDLITARVDTGSSETFFARNALIDRAVNVSGGDQAAADALVQLLAGPGHTASHVLFAWATAFIELATDEWLARVALGETPRSTIVRLNTYRTVVGLPVLGSETVAEVRSTGLMPDWPGAAEHHIGAPAGQVLDDAHDGLRMLEAAVAALAPRWTPPVIEFE